MAAATFSIDTQFARAKSLERSGDALGAARLYDEILSRFPANRRARAALEGLSATIESALQAHVRTNRRMLAGGQAARALEMAENLAHGAPQTVPVLALLGEVRLATGAVEAAVDVLEEARVMPGGGAVRLLLGSALHRAGRGAEAVAVLREVLAETPDHGAARFNLAIALGATGDTAAAISECREAMRRLPDGPELHLTLGNLLRQAGEAEAAEAEYEAAIVLRPNFPPVLHNLAGLLLEQGRAEEALSLYDHLLAATPGNAPDVIGRARALARLDRVEEDYARAAELLPTEVTPWLELGHLRRETGDAAGAEAAYLAALERDPERGTLWEGLALSHDFVPGDPALARMKAVLSRAAEDREGCGLHFALARGHDRTGDTATAFRHYATGNRIRRALLGHDPAADARLFAHITTAFAEAPAPVAASGTGPVPVFILGMPRSGTSLVEQVLAAHPQVHAAGELPVLHRATHKHLAETLATGSTPDPVALQALRMEYLAHVRNLYAGKPVVTDKTPTNFLWIGAILAALPEARILHVTRDPMAVGWSCFTTNFSGTGHGFSCDLAETGRYIRAHDALMSHWHGLHPGRIHTVDYEALVQDPDAGIRGIVAAAGLDWAEDCLDFHRLERRVATASALQVRERIHAGSSDAWRRYSDHLGPLREALRG